MKIKLTSLPEPKEAKKQPCSDGLSERTAAPCAPVKAAPLTLSKHLTIEQAFRAIAINCLMHMSANRDGITQRQDVESVHQMRVGLRRLRTLFALFKAVLPVPDLLQQELTWLGAQLGAARDWDVLAGSTLPAVAAHVSGEEGLDAVTLAAQALARQQHAAATAATTRSVAG